VLAAATGCKEQRRYSHAVTRLARTSPEMPARFCQIDRERKQDSGHHESKNSLCHKDVRHLSAKFTRPTSRL
jgi:hypothetical protein